MLHHRLRVGSLLALISCCSAGAHAQIVNPSFESPAISAGSFGPAATGWTGASVWYPGAGYFSTPVPDGNQIGYTNGGSLSQQLSNVLTVGQTNLTAAFGQRLDGFTGVMAFQLYAGNTLLASKTLQPNTNLVAGQFVDATVSYTALAGDPLLGSPLKVSVALVSGAQADVDNFRLTTGSTATPEPGSFALLLGSGLGWGLFLHRRARKK